MNFNVVEQNKGNLVDMFGTFMEIGGVQFTPNQKEKAVCKIADDNGVSHKVHLHKGNGELPTPAQLQQRHAFSLKAFQGTYQGGAYTGYSGFWKDKIQVNQPSQPPPITSPQARQGPQQAAGPTKTLQPDGDAIAEGKVRHGLVCAYIQSNRQMNDATLVSELEAWKAYIMTGHHPDNVPEPDPSIQNNQDYDYANDNSPPPVDDIPF